MCCVRKVDDPRKTNNGTVDDFVEILVIAMAAVLSDCETAEDIAYWAYKKETWRRQFLPLKNGFPSERTFLRLFRALDPKQFEGAFRRSVAEVVGTLNGGVAAVDGKKRRASGRSSETAIPELLKALHIKDLLITIYAMGCPKIARQITDQGSDYSLALKGNQPALLEAMQTDFIDQYQSPTGGRHRQVHKSRGRIVGQIASVLGAKGAVGIVDWPKCKAIRLVDSLRKVVEEESNCEQRYYISSRALTAEQLPVAVRDPWALENRLHRVLDVNVGKDASTVRKDNAPQNLSLSKKIVLNLIRLDTTDQKKTRWRLKRNAASRDDDFRVKITGPVRL
ncbi:MAG: Transposase [Candidatus Accumulibacter appositus]|uniref:Transposase n=1 Tax=Candidatus Accumulibacter appositus TaxID=1454003 RepID=A0A011PTL5_9PROT|nr:ISAs1 family transposase [Accumulibacter sp.]EXI80165.1 MAG: Transposase [Candidatus Accumulibacter appositus]HRF03612.1 ISAs1 family transposase [Accumulibacter sp.]